jgi:hypothetical protein
MNPMSFVDAEYGGTKMGPRRKAFPESMQGELSNSLSDSSGPGA